MRIRQLPRCPVQRLRNRPRTEQSELRALRRLRDRRALACRGPVAVNVEFVIDPYGGFKASVTNTGRNSVERNGVEINESLR